MGAGGGLVALILIAIVACVGGQYFVDGDGNGGFDDLVFDRAPPEVPAGTANEPVDRPVDSARDFVGRISGDIQRLWAREFRAAGHEYLPTRIVLFTRSTRSGCGPASAAAGPFYCTLDRKIYADLGFFNVLSQRFGAPGDFPQAYVIAHEYGHHVQNLLGINRRVRQQTMLSNQNELSIRLELQADCFAGVWGHSACPQGILEEGDIEEGLDAAEAVGDDRIQRATTGRVDPETFNHGTSERRRTWFLRGLESGDPNGCDTISGGA